MVASHASCWFIVGSSLLALVTLDRVQDRVQVSNAAKPPKAEEVVLRGKVVPLADVLKSSAPDLKVDPEPIAGQVALICDDKSVVPLIPDEASRALFKDPRLQNRSVEIRGRRISGLPYLQVITLKVEQDGRYRTPEYFCHVCTISLRSPQTCPCCQGPMEFRMKPELP